MSKRELTYALPKLPDGRTYVTDQMMDDEPTLRHFINRTRGAWHYHYDTHMYTTEQLSMRMDPTTRINYFNETITEEGRGNDVRTTKRHTQEEND